MKAIVKKEESGKSLKLNIKRSPVYFKDDQKILAPMYAPVLIAHEVKTWIIL